MRIFPLLLLLILPSCNRVERAREEAAERATAETMIRIEGILAEKSDRVRQLASSANRILSPLPVMTESEENALRQFLNATHVARARRLGVRAADRAAIDSLIDDERLIALEDSTQHWIVRPGTSPAHVVPSTRALLHLLGERFQQRLAAMGLPAYRLEVTSALRSSARQDRLRQSNANAAAGVSSHEFGTTVDISYSAFAPPAEMPESLLNGVPPQLTSHVERIADLAFESVSGRKSRELGAIFSQVLLEAQAEGIVLVIYERQQTVYHLTVGRELEGN